MTFLARLRRWEHSTRPTDPDVAAATDRRWDGLPEHVSTPARLLGRRTTGCEGTHGVFPACDFRCNRLSWGAWVGDADVPVLGEADARDLHNCMDVFRSALRTIREIADDAVPISLRTSLQGLP